MGVHSGCGQMGLIHLPRQPEPFEKQDNVKSPLQDRTTNLVHRPGLPPHR